MYLRLCFVAFVLFFLDDLSESCHCFVTTFFCKFRFQDLILLNHIFLHSSIFFVINIIALNFCHQTIFIMKKSLFPFCWFRQHQDLFSAKILKMYFLHKFCNFNRHLRKCKIPSQNMLFRKILLLLILYCDPYFL